MLLQIVVAIDFGTTYSGYAYSFTHDPDNVHIMRKWEGKKGSFINYITQKVVLGYYARLYEVVHKETESHIFITI